MVSAQQVGKVKFRFMAGVGVAIVSTALIVISPIVGGKYNGGCEKRSPYECGFDPSGVGHINFSVRYFLIAIIFLIFDVEIALLLPVIVTPVVRLFRI